MPIHVAVQPSPVTVFRYIGNTYMLFYGPSGKKYRFSGYGAEREVDPRDHDFVRNIPNLREVRRAS